MISSRRTLACATLMLLAARASAAEDALDPEFLDYLATLEGDEEDWTWFWEEREEDEEESAAKPAEDEQS